MIDSATSDAGPTSFAPEEGRVERARSSEAPHPLGLAPAPQGKLDVPPGAYMHVGPPLPANALGTAQARASVGRRVHADLQPHDDGSLVNMSVALGDARNRARGASEAYQLLQGRSAVQVPHAALRSPR